MVRAFLAAFLVLATVSAHAAEFRDFKKVDADHAQVSINTGEPDGVQAASYVDAQENQKFIDMMLADPNSKLAKLKASIEQETCQANSTPDNSWIAGCGEVQVTEVVRTSFGRGGWMSAGAGYAFFVGFLNDGTGHFFDVNYIVTFGEGVNADVDKNGEYKGTLTKQLSLGSIKKISLENQ